MSDKQKIIKKKKRLAEIEANIAICDKKIKDMPTEDVNFRVTSILNNPCLDGKFYLNALYKSDQSDTITDDKELDSYKETVRFDTLSYDNTDNIGFGFILQKGIGLR